MYYLAGIKVNSIQEYIFQSSLLKENIGASHITNSVIFYQCLKGILEKQFDKAGEMAWDDWIKKPGGLHIVEPGCKCEVLEIGGGGVMLLYKENGAFNKTVQALSLEVLLNFPGLKLSFSVNTGFEEQEFMKHRSELLRNLETDHKNAFYNTVPAKPGFVQNCNRSQFASEFPFDKTKGITLMVSGHSNAKISQADRADDFYKELINDDRFTLTTEIEKLGQNPEAGYISVVHIDGNEIGKKVSNQASIKLLREFSIKRAELIIQTISGVIKHRIIGKTDTKTGMIAGIQLQKEKGKWILPIRPLLNGGDDITFVCEGRLGIYLAESFLQYFTADPDIVKNACAGVAIVKTKFPFYKAYVMAEELCMEAKGKSRSENVSCLSFFYSATTYAGSLEQIRKRTHKTQNEEKLYYGPYSLAPNDSMVALKTRIRHFMDKQKISKNKVLKLREVLWGTDTSRDLFIKELVEQEQSLPEGEGLHLFKNGSTPYFDPIELMDFYPQELLAI